MIAKTLNRVARTRLWVCVLHAATEERGTVRAPCPGTLASQRIAPAAIALARR